MVVAVVICLIAGIALAQFYKVFVLLPATIVALLGQTLIEVGNRNTVDHALIAILCVAFALQAGFLCGAFLSSSLIRAQNPFIVALIHRTHK
jgi:uncharacterized protein YneF (UPF0154 family)